MLVVCFVDGKNFVREEMWYFGLKGPWILIGLDRSVVEHLTSDAVVPGSNSPSSHTFSFVFLSIFDMCISLYTSIPPITITDFF